MSAVTLQGRLALHRFVCLEFGYLVNDLDGMLERLRPARGIIGTVRRTRTDGGS